jgi:hypothetical protein
METYLLNPDWQERFPLALVGSGQREFLRWLRDRFPKFAPFRRLKSLPRVLSGDEEAALRQRMSTGWNSNAAFATLDGQQRLDPALGVNLLSQFCFGSGLQRAARTTKTALESADVLTSARDMPTGVHSSVEPRGKWLGGLSKKHNSLSRRFLFEVCYRRSGLARRANSISIAYW